MTLLDEQIFPGRLSALAVLGAQDPLVDSAMAASQGRPPQIGLERTAIPAGLTVDTSFSAVPLGSDRDDFLEAAAQPSKSERFVIRVFLEQQSLETVPEQVDGMPLFSDPVISPFLACFGDPAVGDITHVKANLDAAVLAAGGLDGSRVAVAIVDSGIDLNHLTGKLGRVPGFDVASSWTPPGTAVAPGRHPLGHGTMCAYDALIVAPNATLLDYPVLTTRGPRGAPASGTIGTALRAYADLAANWAVVFAPGDLSKYNALVVNNSWGLYHPSQDFPPGHRGRYIDNPNHPFYFSVLGLARAGADIIFAAGNCGTQCAASPCKGRTVQTIMGANAYAEVLTLAGCDINDSRAGYSSQGPSIAQMYQQKPDLTAYTHFLGSEAFGSGSADEGTSTACPVAAGCVAAIRTKEPPSRTPPAALFAQLNATARKVSGQTGWNADYGYGIIDPVAAAQSLGLLAGVGV
jgi:subtilisin family serine protease